jgi:hypothetical protein
MSRSPSPSTDTKAEANDEAEAMADDEADNGANILANAEAESDGSLGYIMTDSEDDHLHGYATPILLGPNLFLRVSPFAGLVCPVCPNRKACGWIEADARAHMLARAHAPLDGTYTNDKNIARHRALVRNQG